MTRISLQQETPSHLYGAGGSTRQSVWRLPGADGYNITPPSEKSMCLQPGFATGADCFVRRRRGIHVSSP